MRRTLAFFAALIILPSQARADMGFPGVPDLDQNGSPALAGIALAVGIILGGVWVVRMRRNPAGAALGCGLIYFFTLCGSCLVLPWITREKPPRPRPDLTARERPDTSKGPASEPSEKP
jgi:hypothetical protein